MSLEIIGMIGAEKGNSRRNQVSVIGSGVNSKHIIHFAKAHENSGFDKVLVGYKSRAADGFIVAMHAATGGTGNSTELVGTPEQVAESLLKYYRIGCTTLVIRGFNPVEDAIYWGNELIPLLRDKVKKYHKENAVSALAIR